MGCDLPARNRTHAIMVGQVKVGGGAPVSVQSMTNHPMRQTDGGPCLDVAGNLAQIGRLSAEGCEIVRVAIPNMRSLDAFGEICSRSPLPVVADIHFDHRIAVAAARKGAAALRINPGNIGDMDKVDLVIEAAGEAGVPIRIGVNGGSLSQAWRERTDIPLAERLAGSACEFVEHFESRGFDKLAVSAKASDCMVTVETYRLISERLPHVPLHLGVTEAGTGMRGAIKSSVALGILLSEGIGDTLRISLTDDTVLEVRAAWDLLAACNLRHVRAELVSCPTCSRCQVDMIPIAQEVERCLAAVHRPLKVAVMGCEVNGPGEASDADIGVACGRGSGLIFAKGSPLCRVPAESIVDALFEQIDRLWA